MEILKKNLNYTGLILILLGIISFKIWPYKKSIPLILLILGLLALIAYVFLNLSLLKQSFRRKSFIYSSNLFLVIILVIGILALLNYVFARHHYRIDFTEAKIHSLSDQSIKVLKNLKDDINIKSFFREGNFNRATMENLMKIYSYHTTHVKYEFIDPDKNPGLVKRYEVSEDGTTIFEKGERENRITSSTEEDVTNAIIKISREKKKIIIFLEGHGEASIEESGDRGYSMVKEELEKLGYEVKNLSLALSDTFPEKVSLLILSGPEKDLFPNELDTIKNFLHKGGRVFLMIDPENTPGFTPFLKEFGIKLEDDLIVDRVSRIFGGDYFMPVVTEYEDHPITQKFRYATFFPYSRSVEKEEEIPEDISVNIIAKSSPNSWSERQLDLKEVSFDKEKDKAGPIPLATVATIKYKEEKKEEDKAGEDKTKEKTEEKIEETTPKAEGRLAVFGDSGFASNRYYHLSGNGNLFLNTVNWLTEEADLISIKPKTSIPRTIQLTPSQGKLIFFVSLIMLPLAIIITGISIWIRRKSL